MNTLRYILGLPLLVFNILCYSQDNSQHIIQNLNQKAIEYVSINRDSACYFARKSHKLNNGRFAIDEAKNMLIIGRCLQWEGKVDSTYQIYNDLIPFFEKNDMQKELGITYWYLGKVWYNLQQFDKAIPNYLKSEELLEKSGHYELQLKVLNGLGVMLSIKGDYLGGLEYFKKALVIITREGYKDKEFRVIDNIAVNYVRLKEFDKALEFNQRALNMSDTSKRKRFRIGALSNRGIIYEKMGKLDSSIFYFDKMITATKSYGKKITTLYNMSRVYRKQKNYKMSISYLRKIVDNINSKAIMHKHFIKLSEDYLSINRLDSALYFGLKSYDIAKEKNLVESIGVSAKLLAEIYMKKRDLSLANKYLLQHVAYKDSIFNDKNEKKFTKLRVQIETIDKVNEINLLKSQAEVDELKRIAIKRNSTFMVFILVFVIIIMLVVQFYWRKINTKKQELKQTKLEAEIEKGQQELYKQTLHMIHVNNTLDSLEEKVKDAINYNSSDASYIEILKTIKINKSLEKDWENFNTYFSNTHSDFYKSLSSNETKLSNHEKRVCALIKLDLSNREIGTILNIESKSVTMLKYRLKKKIGLTEQVDLGSYIQQL